MRMAVVETFVSVQGEGPSVGRPAAFLRLAGCNLACDWCDTDYSWDWSKHDRTAIVEDIASEALVDRLIDGIPPAVSLLILTGGEPLLQRTALGVFLPRLRARRPDLTFEVETNGTVDPGPVLANEIDLFVVSPKLTNAGVGNRSAVESVASFAAANAILKFVVRESGDVDEAAAFAAAAGFPPHRIWILPEGTRAEDIALHGRKTAGRAIELGFNVSPRLHISLWGDERGR